VDGRLGIGELVIGGVSSGEGMFNHANAFVSWLIVDDMLEEHLLNVN